MSATGVKRRVLGIDFGQSRIGVATSDELQMLAHPVETVAAASPNKAAARIAQIALEKNAERIVVGLPRHLNGSLGASAKAALAFAEMLRPLVQCEVMMLDERMTTVEANRVLQAAGRKARETRGFVDQVAAQVILQSFLDRAADAPRSFSPAE